MEHIDDVIARVSSIASDIEETKKSAPEALDAPHLKLDFPQRPISMNGIKHGLTGQNLLLTVDEFGDYIRMGLGYMQELLPVGMREMQIAQRIVDTNWRLNRIVALDNNMFNEGLEHRAPGDHSTDQNIQKMRSHAQAYRQDCAGPNAFDKLGRYETRLHRMMPQLQADLDALQANRLRRTGAEKFEAAESEALKWYERMARHAAQLDEARNDLAAKSASRKKQTGSPSNPDGKTWSQLKAHAESLLQQADDAGMLPPEESANFAEYKRAA